MIVCVFQGSFDPFHRGHLEIVQVVLKLNLAECVVIAPNNPNKTKPWRSDLNFRCTIIQLMIKGLENVSVSYMDADKLVCDLKKQGHIVYGVIGSDHGTLKLKVDMWFVVPRDGYEAKKDENVLPKAEFQHQHLSSTQVRENICELSKFYDDPDVISLLAQHFSRNQVKIEEKRVLKKFPNIESFQLELDSYLKIPVGIKVPSVIDTDYKNCILTFSREGTSAKQKIQASQNRNEWFNIGHCIGQALVKLHNTTTTIPHDIDAHKKLSKIEISDALAKYLENPGLLGYVHGDASLNNFLVGDKGVVFLIDFSGIAKYGDQGIPAYEYFQFISSVYWTLTGEKIAQTLAGFQQGYGKLPFTDEAKSLFHDHFTKRKFGSITYQDL